MNQRRKYEWLNAGQTVTLANGETYTAKKDGVYVLFDNGSVLGPYKNYEEAELAADGTVSSWLNLARNSFH